MFTLVPQAPQTTKCRICGRTLTDPESIREGAGPVCRGGVSKGKESGNQMSINWDKPELIICMGNSGFDAQGKQIVSGKDEMELATNILKFYTEPNKGMAREFAEVIRGATRGVVRQKGIEEFIRRASQCPVTANVHVPSVPDQYQTIIARVGRRWSVNSVSLGKSGLG